LLSLMRGITTGCLSYALKGKLPAGLCLIIIGTEGVAAAKASGKSWEDVSTERLYQPLGMRNTSSRFADFMAAGNRAVGHVRQDGAWVAKIYTRPRCAIARGRC
jgi:hypothetical protein